MISLRPHGDSSGDFNDIGETLRVTTWSPQSSSSSGSISGRPIVVMGVSLGSAAAIFAAQELGLRVQGYILESPYQDLKTAVWNRTQNPTCLRSSRAAWICGAAAGWPGIPACTSTRSPRSRPSPASPSSVPVLVLAGEADPLARPVEAKALLGRVAGHRDLLLFPGAGHHNLLDSAPDDYRGAFLGFCGRLMGRSPR